MNRIFINILASLCLFSLCACSDKIIIDDENVNVSEDDIIDISFVTEAGNGRTRAYSKGSHIDQLIYKIYKKVKVIENDTEVEKYVEDDYFLANDTYKKYDENENLIEEHEHCGVIDGPFPYSIRLIRKEGISDDQKYKIVCWAQKKDSEYYDLSKFPENISINYSKALNNLEELDAFYCAQEFCISDKKVVLELKRPFAQINIGTSGWDYEGMALIEPNPAIIKYSKIVIEGAAKSFSPFYQRTEDKDEEGNDNLTNITFDWAKIPAYRYLEETDLKSVTGVYTDDHSTALNDLGIFTLKGVNEEFLFIDLPNPNNKNEAGTDIDGNFQEHQGYDHEFADYIGWKKYDALCAQYSKEELKPYIFTETFKYLSMCYVLVPFETGADGKVTGSTVKVKFDCSDGIKQSSEAAGGDVADSDAASGGATDNAGADASTQSEYNSISDNKNVFELDNVPVASNHRTNIVATDGTGFFMNTNDLKVSIYTESFADYYKHYHAVDEEWYEQFDPDADDNYHGENGGTDNGEYGPPEGEYDPDLFKKPLLRKVFVGEEYIKDSKYSNLPYSYLPSTDNYIRAFVYVDKNDEFDDSREVPENITIRVDSKLYTSVGTEYKGAYEHKFYIGGSELTKTDYTLEEIETNKYYYNITINSSLIKNHVKDKSTKTLDEDYDMYYYPIEFTVKTTLPETEGVESQYRVEDDQSIDIHLYPLYKSYTFSSTSKDDGGGIWNEITRVSGSKKEFTNYFENGNNYRAYAIDNGTEVTSNDITVKSREGNGGNNSVALFQAREDDTGDQADHLNILGACSDTIDTSDGGQVPQCHYIKFNIDKKCKITVKWGRDRNADNIGSNGTDMHTRNLNINWGQNKSYIIADTWKAYPYSDTENTYKTGGTTGTQKYSRTESRIAPTVTTDDISGPVYIYEKKTGTSYYWILVSPAK